jgi:hypothetical protein
VAGPHTSAVLLASKSRDTDRMTFLAVTSFMSWDTHKAWPPVRYIAHGIGRSVRQTQKCLRRLEASSELVVERRTGASHVYTLAPRLLDLAKQIAAGERGLWEKLSTPGDDARRTQAKPRDVDNVHLGDVDEVHGGNEDTRHPNRNSTVKEQSPTKVAVDIKSQVKALKAELAQKGVKTFPQDKTSRLEQLVLVGASAQEVFKAVNACVATPGVAHPFAYGAQTLLNQLAEGTSPRAAPASDWDEAPWQVVVARGEELGVGTWDPDRPTVHFPVYKNRVTNALRQLESAASHMPLKAPP